MEESGLVILIVTMSDKKCIPFASGQIFQVCRIQTVLIVIWHSRGENSCTQVPALSEPGITLA